ncbi:MAG: transcriptional repressor LexA [bacterium]
MLTKRQKDTLSFIKIYIAKNGFPPSIREVGKGLNLSSSATAFTHVRNLENKGYLKIGKNKSRNIELLCLNEYLKNNDGNKKIPLLFMNDQNPINTIQNPVNHFLLPSTFLTTKEDHFILKYEGQNIIELSILNNDNIICTRKEIQKDGDLVIIFYENKLHIKNYYKEKDFIKLKSHNTDDLLLETVQIIGTITGIYRKY